MAYGIGIDTGGTFTDAVVFDFETGKVLAKGKSPTTRRDLAEGIGRALDMLPPELLAQARTVALSTTLATNACVENKGGRARLVLIGTDEKTLRWVQADKKYGLPFEDVLCVESNGSFDGKIVDHPDWDAVTAEHDEFFRAAEALSVAELNAMRNGAVVETAAKAALGKKYAVPLVAASELVNDLNVMERGATALLNARLLPVVDQFMKAVGLALEQRGVHAMQAIVRSDGSLMTGELAAQRPVETILSGPAASVMGCRALADCEHCLVVDMGGTTTDISVIRGGVPEMSGGIRIGGWRTQIKGVYIDTFGLGGDTRIFISDGKLTLDTRRVEPLCFAARKWPQIREMLETLVLQRRPHTQPLHEALYLVRMPENTDRYTPDELALLGLLERGPQMIGGGVLDPYKVPSGRLEDEGVVMRCGLTPTDIMHVRGDYAAFDADAARLAARYFLQTLPRYFDEEEELAAFCEEAYDLVKRRLFENIARVLIEAGYPGIFRNGLGAQLEQFIAMRWEKRNEPADRNFFSLSLDVSAALIGMGAPIHVFLPDVARALGTKCIIPEHSEVANAVGAIVANITAEATVEILKDTYHDGTAVYTVYSDGAQQSYKEFEDAIAAAGEAAKRLATAEARRRGATGELQITLRTDTRRAHARDGAAIDLGTKLTARVTTKLKFGSSC